MKRIVTLSTLIAALTAAGCQTQTQFLQSMEEQAMQAALARGKFELNCPAATASVLSKEVVQPAIQGPYFMGPERAEYTIGIAGCGQRATYLVLCPQGGSGCFSAGSRNNIIQAP
jgi:hypothetical protein